MRGLLLAFVPLFFAIDIAGLLPIYLGFMGGLDDRERRSVARDATLTSAGVGVGFVLVGDIVLRFLGVTVGDLQVAGGLLLLVLAVYSLLAAGPPERRPGGRLGITPLGVPTIVGPAVLTTLLALSSSRGYTTTLVAFFLNLVLVWLALRWASLIGRVLGETGSQVGAKVSNLLLAAIAVMMIRVGILAALGEGRLR
jgi:multiple antibiotic resistance protein